ncbi:MAG TPA: hypothetical protein PLT46_04255 [Burkholderiaceae bacterium]|nr:hypothetical protein [Burkholderiaceae bacterium]
MHIENVTINIGHGSAMASAFLASLVAGRSSPEPDTKEDAPSEFTPPAIGEEWPAQGGIYVGISRGEDGEPDAHLVLLPDVVDKGMPWADAVKWAEDLGNGARLPTRFESALLYANVRDQLDTDHWHWTGTPDSEGYAWLQDFSYGYQYYSTTSYGGRARAVRLIPLGS